jgi:hypothetical protein
MDLPLALKVDVSFYWMDRMRVSAGNFIFYSHSNEKGATTRAVTPWVFWWAM